MNASKRLIALAASASLALGAAAPAVASTSSTHWSSSACKSYAKKYKGASSSKKKAADKTLKAHGCGKVKA